MAPSRSSRGSPASCAAALRALVMGGAALGTVVAWLDVGWAASGCTGAAQYAVQRRRQFSPTCPRAGGPRDDQHVQAGHETVVARSQRLPQAPPDTVAHHGLADATAHRDAD